MVTLWVLATLAHAVMDQKPLTLTVRPLISFAPTNLEIRVRVRPELSDRYISVRTDSGAFSRRSEWEITSDQPLYVVRWTDLPAGEYVIYATMGSGNTVRAADRVSVIVRGL